jgi:hypothetical protein
MPNRSRDGPSFAIASLTVDVSSGKETRADLDAHVGDLNIRALDRATGMRRGFLVAQIARMANGRQEAMASIRFPQSGEMLLSGVPAGSYRVSAAGEKEAGAAFEIIQGQAAQVVLEY